MLINIRRMIVGGEAPVQYGEVDQYETTTQAAEIGAAFRLALTATDVDYNEIWLETDSDSLVIATAVLDHLVV